jgi:hypothetical protein
MAKVVRDSGSGQPSVQDNNIEHLAADSAHTPVASAWINGAIRQVPTAARALTTETGTNYDAALPGAKVGDSFTTIVFNNSAGANAITFVAGAGVTFKPTTTISVAQNKTAILTFVKTGAATYDMYQTLGA